MTPSEPHNPTSSPGTPQRPGAGNQPEPTSSAGQAPAPATSEPSLPPSEPTLPNPSAVVPPQPEPLTEPTAPSVAGMSTPSGVGPALPAGTPAHGVPRAIPDPIAASGSAAPVATLVPPQAPPGLKTPTRTQLPPPFTSAGPTSRSNSETQTAASAATVAAPSARSTILRPPQPSTPGAGALFKAFLHCWPLALSLALGVAAVVAVAMWILVPRPKAVYQAAARLQVAARPPRIVFPTTLQDPSELGTYLQTQMDLLKSRPILTAAVRQAQAADLPAVKRNADDVVRWMERELKLDFTATEGNRSQIIRISLAGESPNEVVVLANAIKDAFLTETNIRERDNKEKRLSQLKSINDKAILQLTDLQGRYEAAKLRGGARQAEEERAVLRDLDAYARERSQLQVALLRAQAQLKSMLPMTQTPTPPAPKPPAKAPAKPAIPPEVINEYVERDPEVQKLLADIQRLQQRINVWNRDAVQPQNFPEYRQLQSDLRAAQDALTQRRKTYRSQLEYQVKMQQQDNTTPAVELPTLPPPPDPRKIAEESVAQLELQLKMLDDTIDKKSQIAVDLARQREGLLEKRLGNINTLWLEKDRQETYCKFILDELKATELEANAPSRVSSFEDAQQAALVPPKDPNREIKMVAMSGFGALFVVLLAVSFWEFQARRLYSADDVSEQLGMRLLGSLPVVSEAVRRHPIEADGGGQLYWHSYLTEAIDSLRTVLLHEARTMGSQVVMVTSALEGEGKTTLASHLAVSLARAGKRTLLVDGDTVHPQAHLLFDQPREPGLSELLRGQVAGTHMHGQMNVADVIRPTQATGLWMMPAGQADAQTIQALARDGMQAIFERLKMEYDVIIVDCSPVLPVAHTLLIGKHADSVLLTVLRDHSRVQPVYAAYHRLVTLGIRVLGTVFVGARGNLYGASSYTDYASATPPERPVAAGAAR